MIALVAAATAAVGLTACGGGGHGDSKPSVAHTPRAGTAPAPPRPQLGKEVVYTAARPHVSRVCGLAHLGRNLQGPAGAHWLILPPAPSVTAVRHGRRVVIAWRFRKISPECRPGWVEFTLRSATGARVFAGGTRWPLRVRARRGRTTVHVLPPPADPPYVLLSDSVAPDGKITGNETRTRVP